MLRSSGRRISRRLAVVFTVAGGFFAANGQQPAPAPVAPLSASPQRRSPHRQGDTCWFGFRCYTAMAPHFLGGLGPRLFV